MSNQKYAWEEWLSKPSITLRSGKHFEIPIGSFLQQLRNAASRLEIKITVKELPGRVIVKHAKE